MPRIGAHGVELYYEDRGTGLPILGIHGSPSSAALWEPAAVRLAEHGRCITYDRRGYGRSERPVPLTLDVGIHAADAAALLAALDAAPAVVIGRSYGGGVAVELARRHPDVVAAIVLLEGDVQTLDPGDRAELDELSGTILALADRSSEEVAAALFALVVGEGAWETFSPELRSVFVDNVPAMLADLRGDFLEMEEHEFRALSQPTLIVCGRDSAVAPRRASARMAELVPGAELVEVPGGHLVDPAHPAVLAFIDGVAGQAMMGNA
jgi:pimeloyl-ACP methyl ester carboxylesterase